MRLKTLCLLGSQGFAFLTKRRSSRHSLIFGRFRLHSAFPAASRMSSILPSVDPKFELVWTKFPLGWH
jgi:hypothetical protein